MKAGYWVKLALGLALIALLCLAAYKLLDGILDLIRYNKLRKFRE